NKLHHSDSAVHSTGLASSPSYSYDLWPFAVPSASAFGLLGQASVPFCCVALRASSPFGIRPDETDLILHATTCLTDYHWIDSENNCNQWPRKVLLEQIKLN